MTTRSEKHRSNGDVSCTSHRYGDGTVLVSASGELDLNTSGGFREVLDDAQHAGANRLIVDLSDVTFMDSTALSALVGVQRQLNQPLDIVVTRDHLRRLLFITGLNTVFLLHETIEEARGRVV